jgi:DNA polymerase (family 10)
MFNASFDFSAQHETEPTSTAETSEAPLTNAKLAEGLERIAQLLGSREQVRCLALKHAAAAIRFSQRPLTERVTDAGVEGVHALGIDYELSGVVTDWVRTGRLWWLERLESRRQRELEGVPGIGPRLARELRDMLGVVDLEGLARAAREGRLSRIYGFGPKRVKMIEAVLAARAA